MSINFARFKTVFSRITVHIRRRQLDVLFYGQSRELFGSVGRSVGRQSDNDPKFKGGQIEK